ncbi:MAG: DUF3800 domain-containing protein [Ignavibacteriales bacterium]|nr:DUF3800 domain-containing protein [Ignavibacteriales bacterium]
MAVDLTKENFFIDESGDPNFYGNRHKLLVGTPGYQPLLLIGMIVAEDRKHLRNAVLDIKSQIENDPLYKSLHSVKPGWYLHAIEDHPDIRTKFINSLRDLEGFKTFIVIGRKDVNRFHKLHHNKPTEFYYDLLYHLLKDRMNKEDYIYQLFLAQRQRTKMDNFSFAVAKAIERDNSKRKKPIVVNYQCDIVLSSQYPELSIIDYLLWALQRYIILKEDRFYNALINKYNLIIDLYDSENYTTKRKGTSNYYPKKNPFDLKKTSDFEV